MIDQKRNSGGGRVYWTVGELAKMAGVSPYRMRGLLKSNDVPIGKHGQKFARPGVVLKSTLEAAFPDLVDSIRGSR